METAFVSGTNILMREDAQRKLRRMAFQIAEDNADEPALVIAGIEGNGVLLAQKLMAELKNIIQDQVDTQFTFDLKKISGDLELNPSYLSREFSKYFDDMNFGEYIRKIRINKAIDFIKNSNYPLTKIAYLTGFSDQSHFTRIFRQHTGKSPSAFKKELQKGKPNTNG